MRNITTVAPVTIDGADHAEGEHLVVDDQVAVDLIAAGHAVPDVGVLPVESEALAEEAKVSERELPADAEHAAATAANASDPAPADQPPAQNEAG